MKKPSTPKNEASGESFLESYHILNDLPEESFDDLSLIASQICKTPIALISVIDQENQWIKSKYGLETNEIPKDLSFYEYVINEPSQLFEISDVKNDKRFKKKKPRNRRS